jgi:peptidase inhibitor family I36
MSRGPGLAVAVLALITAAIGMASSPIWAPHVCHAIGVCNSSDTVANNTNGAGNSNGGTGWTCPGGLFCGWDGPDGTGEMIIEAGSTCTLYDIGSAGKGDRLTSYQNRTGKQVGLVNWTGGKWVLLTDQPLQDGDRGNLKPSADNQTDGVSICYKP